MSTLARIWIMQFSAEICIKCFLFRGVLQQEALAPADAGAKSSGQGTLHEGLVVIILQYLRSERLYLRLVIPCNTLVTRLMRPQGRGIVEPSRPSRGRPSLARPGAFYLLGLVTIYRYR
jgi:hypothetical protein